MAEKWQKWMPFHIDRFRGSPEVQAMHPAARWGFLSLLASSWQSDDCTLSMDPIDLATESGLGDELWAMYGARILRKFVVIDGRLRNEVCYAEWLEAKIVFEKRRAGAERTNSSRSANGERTQSERPADTETYTETLTKTCITPLPPSGGREGEIFKAEAGRVMDSCGITDPRLSPVIVKALEQHSASARGQPSESADLMISQFELYRSEAHLMRYQNGPRKFVSQGHWMSAKGWPYDKDLVAEQRRKFY